MHEMNDQMRPFERVPTGIAGLDTIIGGGLLAGGLYLVAGPPGAGKTILGNQFCFHHVATGGRAAYITLLAETHGRMLGHLRSLTFFDPAPIGSTLLYYSAYHAVEGGGLKGLFEYLRAIVRNDTITLLVIDGLGPVVTAADSDISMRRFLAELQVQSAASGCTTLLLAPSSYPELDYPTHTMVDGLFALDRRRLGTRAIRELEVRKFRGSGYLDGLHQYLITDAGLVVYPRIEALYALPSRAIREVRSRVPFGIPRLDDMLHGGVPDGSTTMLLGSSGSGKSILGLHFLARGARTGESSLYFGFYEAPDRLLGKAEGVGLRMSTHVRAQRLTLLWQPPLEHSIDALAERLLAAISARGVRRLFIDGLDAFVRVAVHADRIGQFFSALSNELRAREVTTLYSIELPEIIGTTVAIPIGGISLISENVIYLRSAHIDGRFQRQLAILKLRESGYDPAIRIFSISDHGIEIEGMVEHMSVPLAGTSFPAVAAPAAPPVPDEETEPAT